jgi:2Fe-2S ferredoxin
MNLRAAAREDETVLDAARRAGAPLGNSCGAVGVCARCVIRIVDGADPLGPNTTIETRVTRERNCRDDERLACQAIVLGDCTVTTTYW